MCWPLKAKRCNKALLVPYHTDGWMHRLPRQCRNLLDVRGKWRILTNKNRRSTLGKNLINVSSRIEPILLHSIRNPKCTWNLPEMYVRVFSICKMRVRIGLHGRLFRFYKTPEEHNRHIREVLTPQNNVGVTLNLKKCQFFTESIDDLGHVIFPGRLELVSRTTDEIWGLQEPDQNYRTQIFLGPMQGYPTIRSEHRTTSCSIK